MVKALILGALFSIVAVLTPLGMGRAYAQHEARTMRVAEFRFGGYGGPMNSHPAFFTPYSSPYHSFPSRPYRYYN